MTRVLSVPEDVPKSGEWADGTYECPECGESFDDETWSYVHAGDAWGGSAYYSCPSCGSQSITVIH